MAGLLEGAYFLLSSLWHILEEVIAIRLLGLRRFNPPSEETKQRVLRALEFLRNCDKVTESLEEQFQVLAADEDLLAITDITGFNILQQAIISGDTQVVKCLLERGFSPDTGVCSLPIQLAASLGCTEVVQLLIDSGARTDRQVGICYPQPHSPVQFRANYLGLSSQPVYKCHSVRRTPIQCAIDGDHVTVVKTIYTYMTLSDQCTTPAQPSDLIHYACKAGASKCLTYFLTMWPELMEEEDANGDTALLLAVPWGEQHVRLLMEHGVDMRKRSQHGETVLHRLYRDTCTRDGYLSMSNTTKFLLSAGLEEDVSAKDFKEESALHVLVGHLSFVIKDVGDIFSNDNTLNKVQSLYQEQVIQCMDLLLNYNADINSVNASSHQPLSKLMHIVFATCFPSDPNPCVHLDPSYHYVIDFSVLNKALKVLLSHGANPDFQCGTGHTAVILLLQCLLYGSPETLVRQSEEYVSCLQTLLSHGAKTNFITHQRATCSTLMARIGKRFFQIDQSETREGISVRDRFSDLVNSCLEFLLKYGLNPNHTTTKRSRHLEGGTGNALIEFVRLAEYAAVPRDLRVVHQWLKTLLQWGGDPDIEPYPSDPIICHSQSSIFLKKPASQPVSHYIHEVKELQSIFDHGHALDLLLLFYCTMDHQILFECLRSSKFMSHFHPMGATGQQFLSALTELTDNPRSLKRTVRVVIYKTLNRCLAEKVPKLPLPKRLQTYLLEIEF